MVGQKGDTPWGW